MKHIHANKAYGFYPSISNIAAPRLVLPKRKPKRNEIQATSYIWFLISKLLPKLRKTGKKKQWQMNHQKTNISKLQNRLKQTSGKRKGLTVYASQPNNKPKGIMLSEPPFQQTKRHTICPHVLLQQAECFMLVVAAIVLLNFNQTKTGLCSHITKKLFWALNTKTTKIQNKIAYRNLANVRNFKNLLQAFFRVSFQQNFPSK